MPRTPCFGNDEGILHPSKSPSPGESLSAVLPNGSVSLGCFSMYSYQHLAAIKHNFKYRATRLSTFPLSQGSLPLLLLHGVPRNPLLALCYPGLLLPLNTSRSVILLTFSASIPIYFRGVSPDVSQPFPICCSISPSFPFFSVLPVYPPFAIFPSALPGSYRLACGRRSPVQQQPYFPLS